MMACGRGFDSPRLHQSKGLGLISEPFFFARFSSENVLLPVDYGLPKKAPKRLLGARFLSPFSASLLTNNRRPLGFMRVSGR